MAYYGKVEISGVNTANLPVLTGTEAKALFIKCKAGDEAARQQLIEGNLRLVLSIIKRFENRNENMDDLFQIGECGVLVHNECTVPELSDNWKDNITSDSGVRDGTDIPSSFELKGYEVNGNKVKVHPNATKHMAERVNAANGSILVENEMMISFEESVASVLPNVKDSRNFFENVNGWELGIDGSDGTVYHALLK